MSERETPSGPRATPRGLACFFAVLFFFISSHALFAHDPPTEYYDRNLTVLLQPDCVEVHYRLEISQFTLFKLPDIDKQIKLGKVHDRNSLAEACLERFKILIPDKLLGELNGEPLTWVVGPTRIDHLGSVHYHLKLR